MTTPPALLTALEGRYTIHRPLGAGGMAAVYLAHDVRHDRPVALKVMHDALRASIGSERFLREIRIAAGLQHPHIVPLLDSGEAGEHIFYVMPYIDGETLRSVIARGPLGVERAVQFAREIADALAAAHSAGIVHRDLKPENVLLSHDHALLADFGVARITTQGDSRLTEIGFAVGTPTYMAPEQAFGGEDVAAPADLYALGVVLYEMLTGEPPLLGVNAQATFARRLTELPPHPQRLRADVPDWLDEIVTALLAREPDDRPANADAVLASLTSRESVLVPTPVGGMRRELPSVVVLPFANSSPDPDNEFFSDGIAEELINALAQVNALRVIARTSAFSFKGRTVDIRAIAHELGVHHVVEGSVRRAGSQLRVTAQLIDARTGSPQWSGRFDRTLTDVFAIQDEISAAVRDAVVDTLTGATSSTVARYKTDPETYDLILRGRFLLYQSVTRLPEAAAALAKAYERDPRYVPLLAARAEQLAIGAMMAQIPGPEAWPSVRGMMTTLEQVAPNSPELRKIRAMFLMGAMRDFTSAIEELRRYIAESPNDWASHGMLSLLLLTLGEHEEGKWHARRMIAIDPLSPMATMLAANNFAFTDEIDEAIFFAERAIQLDPGYPEGHHMRGYTFLYAGRWEDALRDITTARERGNVSGWPIAKRAIACCALGRRDDVLAAYQMLIDDPSMHDRAADAIACVCQLLGRNDEAFRWLERGVQVQASWIGYIGVDPLFALLARDARFDTFCETHRIVRRAYPRTAFDALMPLT